MRRTANPRAWWLVLPVLVMVAFSAVIINSIVFIQQFGIIEQNRRVFDEAFPEAGDTAPSD